MKYEIKVESKYGDYVFNEVVDKYGCVRIGAGIIPMAHIREGIKERYPEVTSVKVKML